MKNVQKDYMFDYFIQGMDEKMQNTLNMMYLNSCIGAFDVPDRRKIPEADIIMETRKGVALSYAPEQVAV